MASEHEAKNAAQYGPVSHVVFRHETPEEDQPRGLRIVFKKPIVRQWMADGKLHREAEERVPSRFELFFDLLFVGIVHQLAEAAAEEPSGAAVARFVLTFFPSWSLWLDARNFFNVSGQDDVFQRLWSLFALLCLTGYSVNASAIPISQEEFSVLQEEGAVNPIRAAIVFFLAGKATRVAGLLSYAYSLPRFRMSHLSMCAQTLGALIVYIPLIWVRNYKAIITLGALGIGSDYLLKYVLGIWVIYKRMADNKAAKTKAKEMDAGGAEAQGGGGKDWTLGIWIPAINIEHTIERTSAFVVITLGELVVNLLYTASTDIIGINDTYGRAALALITAFLLNWLYFAPGDAGHNRYEHALRRNWFCAVSFTALHWPLCVSIILASSSSALMVSDDNVEPGLMWYWGCGVGFAMLFMVAIELCHRDMVPKGAAKIPRPIRTTFTVLSAMALIFLPFAAHHINSIQLLGITVAILSLNVAFDFYARLCRRDYLRAEKARKESGDVAYDTDDTLEGELIQAGDIGQ